MASLLVAIQTGSKRVTSSSGAEDFAIDKPATKVGTRATARQRGAFLFFAVFRFSQEAIIPSLRSSQRYRAFAAPSGYGCVAKTDLSWAQAPIDISMTCAIEQCPFASGQAASGRTGNVGRVANVVD
jgi:hypothetical protein